MPNTIPQPNLQAITSYPAGIAQAVSGMFEQGAAFWLTLPFTSATADAAVLFTVPTGIRLVVHRALWDIVLAMTGGTSSAIGVSSSNAGYNTKGDILGGASGDVAATLTAGAKAGTAGEKYASNGAVILVGGDTVRFDRITSAFTAGNGRVQLHCSVLPTS